MGRLKHGKSKTPQYGVWHSMMYRCYSPKAQSYQWYGGKGIIVCEEWWDFEVFEKWLISMKYLEYEGLTLDRIDSNGPYAPWNCKLSTAKEQTLNRGKTKWMRDDNGEPICFTDYVIKKGIVNLNTAKKRARQGMNLYEAAVKPAYLKQSRKKNENEKEKKEPGQDPCSSKKS